MQTEELVLEPYGAGFAIFGNTKPHKEELGARGLGASYNPNLIRNGQPKSAGWVIRKDQEQEARDLVASINSGPAPKEQSAPVRVARVARTTSPKRESSMYKELSSYNDITVANKLAIAGEEVGDDALDNRYNLHVLLIDSGKLDGLLEHVLRSPVYGEVSNVTDIQAAVELGKKQIELLSNPTLFDTHICLTALRMVESGDQATVYAIDLVKQYSPEIANKLTSLIKKPEMRRKPLSSPPRRSAVPGSVRRRELVAPEVAIEPVEEQVAPLEENDVEDLEEEVDEPAPKPKVTPARQASPGRRKAVSATSQSSPKRERKAVA